MSINSQESFYSRLEQLFGQQYSTVFQLLFKEEEIDNFEISKANGSITLKLRQITDKCLQRTEERGEVKTTLKVPLELRCKIIKGNSIWFPDAEAAPLEDRTGSYWWNDNYIWDTVVFTKENKIDICCKRDQGLGWLWLMFEGQGKKVTFPSVVDPEKKNEKG